MSVLNIFKLYMSALTLRVERNISNYFPDQFALVLYEQTTLEEQYVAVFAHFLHQDSHGYRTACLALSSSGIEIAPDAEEYINFYGLF